MTAVKPRIMVVDDHPGLRYTLERIFEDEGFEVRGASNGFQAIQLAKETDFDLIFIDIKMPGINGHEAQQGFRKACPHTMAVMMTGAPSGQLLAEPPDEGVYAVLHKPFAMGQIIEIVQRFSGAGEMLPVNERWTGQAALDSTPEDPVTA